MCRFTRVSILALGLALLLPAAGAQYLSELVGFNDDPLNDPANGQEMFRIPEWSVSTTPYILANDSAESYNNNAAFRATGLQTEGAGAMEIFFRWVNAADPDAWVRMTTFSGPIHPNPALHTGGKVRFKISNRSELFRGRVGICLGIRETGVNVPQMNDGGTTGPIEWAGVSTTNNGIVVGDDYIVDTTAAGDDIQVYPVGTDLQALELPLGTAVIAPGPNGVMNTTPAGDDQYRHGYVLSQTGERVPLPVLTLPVENNYQIVEFNLATGQIIHQWDHDNNPSTPYRTDTYASGVTGFTGNGVLDVTRGTLEHIAFTNVTSDIAVLIDVAIDELQFEAPVADIVLPPSIVSPIIAGDTAVTVTNLQYGVQAVALYVNGNTAGFQMVTTTADVVFPIPAAVTGDVYTAAQMVNNTMSALSPGIVVLPEAAPLTFSVAVDEDGDGSCTTNFEFTPVTSQDGPSSAPAPRGVNIFLSDTTWQTVEMPLDNPDLVIGWLGGNGAINYPSPNGKFSIDTFWFTINPGNENAGPYEVLIDAVEALDQNGNVVKKIHAFEDGVNFLQFARGQSTASPTTTALTANGSFDGVSSHRLLWTYPGVTGTEALGMYHNIGYACDTAPSFPDTATSLRFQVNLRRTTDNAVPKPVVQGPLVGYADTVTITNDAAATAIQLYINGVATGGPVTPTGTATVFDGLSLVPGDSVSATQTLAEGESDPAYPRGVADAPMPPAVVSPIAPGATSVQVHAWTYASATAELVTVYVNGVEHGSAIPSGATTTVSLDVTLVSSDVVTATQTVAGIESPESDPITVMFVAPVIYKAPAEGDDSVLVMDIYPNCDQVFVVVNGTTNFSITPPFDADRVEVPVSGLVAGNTITAYYVLDGTQSVSTMAETVTINTRTNVINDHFEYDDATYTTEWANSVAPRLTLDTSKNATDPTGAQCLQAPVGSPRIQKSIPNLTPTATDPVIWNVHIYDAYGRGSSANQFAQLNGQVADYFYQHIGMLSWSPRDTNYYQYRANSNGGPDWKDLKEYEAPMRSIGWHTFTVVHKGNYIDVYVDQLLAAKNIALNATTTYDMARIGPGYATTLAAWYDDYCVEVGPVRFEQVGPQPPATPRIAAPILDGDESVLITGLDASVTSLTIYDDTPMAIGTAVGPFDPNGQAEVTLIRPLVHLETITARAANSVGSTDSAPLEVGMGNGDVLICIGVRETGDTGALGTPGSSTGTMEWIGATEAVDGAPQGVAISPSNDWITFEFDPADAPITAFTGDGVINGTRGTLEHLAVAVDAASANRSTGGYRLYIDNVVNVGAGAGGADFLITDFEDYEVGQEVLFQEPTNSGSTSGDLAPLPSASEVSDLQGNPGQSELLVWFWVDTTAQRWARITTAAALNKPSPIIDLTKPIRFDALLVASEETGCPNPGAAGRYCDGDIDGSADCTVGLADLAKLLSHYGSTNATHDEGDLDGDGDVDLADLAALLGQYGNDCN